MFKKTDPNTFARISNLYIKNSEGVDTLIGNVYFEYQASLYEDVQGYGPVSVVRPKIQKFILDCTQRINIYNQSGLNVSPDSEKNSYVDYPAMLQTGVRPVTEGVEFILMDYSPQTVNTQVESSLSQGLTQGSSTSNSQSTSVGSSVSETNSYGTSVSASYGSMSGATATASYEHSSTVSHEKSSTVGSDVSNSSGRETSNAASMSMKDWGAYALVDPFDHTPVWTFGQEYPWDAISCRKCDKGEVYHNQVKLIIPDAQLSRLYNGGCLYPPSELSVFGINFVMKASWMVVVSNSMPDEVALEHTINYFQGSHILDGGNVNVYMNQAPIIVSGEDPDAFDTTLNLNFMALSPLGVLSNNAIIGFIPNKFIVKPGADQRFKIISTTNDMLIQDTSDTTGGFTASETSLTAVLSDTCPELKMTVYFKVIDSTSVYTLYMKHWKTQSTGVVLTLTINNNPDNPEDTIVITQYVDALEAEGGEGNLLAITLRNQNFSSVDYHDYLQLGLNSIDISIKPITPGGACGYQIRAISIEGA
jgi:hypothetical protein